jgi:Cu+-exporting ATPase
LTIPDEEELIYHGKVLSEKQKLYIAALADHSNHPLSRALAKHLYVPAKLEVENFRETTGKGIQGIIEGNRVRIGSAEYIKALSSQQKATVMHIAINGEHLGYFEINNFYRDDLGALIGQLKKDHEISVLSGDNDREMDNLRKLLGNRSTILFNQKPEDKLEYIRLLQQQGKKVMMIGDGLNDAGALKQSDLGIAVSGQVNNFTPSSDAIIAASELGRLPKFIRLCKANKNIVMASFILSIAYNIIGLLFAIQGNLSPLLAAILMPSSSLSILLITFGSSSLLARVMRL